MKHLSRRGTGFALVSSLAMLSSVEAVQATTFTTTVPGVGIQLPSAYPEAGGVVIVMVGVNGQIYYQFSDPDGAFRGFNSNGQPTQFRGNPFTVNDPIPLDCGIRSCTDYFGGAISEVYIRFSAYDGDTQTGGFDENDISLILNGINVGSWSGLQTERTNNDGTVSQGFQTGFGNNSFNTGWFSSTNPALLQSLLTTGQTTTQVLDDDPNDNYWDFRRGESLDDEALRTIAPGYEFEKTTTATDYSAVGDEITYTYQVTNIGSVNINNLTIFDDKVDAQGGTVSCDRTTINETTGGGSAEVATCTATYTVTQEDIDEGSLTNIARANGTPEFGVLGEVTDQVTLPGPAQTPDMTLTKVAREQAFSAVGDVITYDYEVENTGNTTLTDVSVSDNLIPGLSCDVATLLPDDTLTCVGTYTITQDDLDAFAVSGTPLTNTATADAQDRGQAALTRTVDESITGPAAAPAIVLEKSALQSNFDAEGDVLQFRIEITNTGNVTWPGPPVITDALITGAGGSVSCPTGPVAPLGSLICSADYAVTQDNVDDGEVLNSASGSITVGGQTVSDSDDVTVPAIQTTGLTLVKQLNPGSATRYDATGVVLIYDYVLTNTGNVTLQTPAVTDDRVGVTCTATEIVPGSSVTCTSANFLTSQPDLDAGSVINIASATALDPDGATVSAGPETLTVSADQMPEITLDKTVPVVPAVDFFEGQTVTYTYEITNDGNVTLTDPITVSDDKFPNPIDCGTDPLAPGDSRTCTADYTISQADEDLGFVSNTATASDGTTTSNADTETIPQAGTDAITLTKTADLASVTSASDVITYTFTVTNVGDRSIGTGRVITINDARLTNVTCAQPVRIFPVGQGSPNSVTCTGSASPTQAELDAGEVVNTATAEFTRDNGGNPFTVVSPSAMATVPVAITPAFTLDKIGPATFGALGDVITYTFRVTNLTEQTISEAIVTDPLIPGLACTLTDIGPLGSADCTGDYTVTQADVDAESIDNTAEATGTSSTGAAIPPAMASETTPIDPAEAVKSLSLSKTANVPSFSVVGEQVRYTFAVANTGTQTLTDITVNDPLLGLTCSIPSLAVATLDDTSCQATYTVTQDDIDAGEIVNVASASAPDTTGDSSTSTVPGPTRNADFTVEKSADDATNVIAGQTVTYSYEVVNTGNVTLTDVVLTDSHTSASGTSALTISGGGRTGPLAPGDRVTLTATYLVTQDDIDAGNALTNTVSGTGTPPSGLTPPTDDDTETVTVDPADPVLRVEKTEVDGSGTFGTPGSSESYTFEVFNDGNVTLSNLVLTDDLTGFSCALNDLAPGASTTTCADTTALATSYTIQQSDIDARFLPNEAMVNGTAPDNSAQSASDTVTLDGPTQTPAIDMVKTATGGANFAAVGDEITYDYVITNTGNITLTAPFSVADNLTTVTCPATPGGGVAPGGTLTCTASYFVTQGDLNTGSVTNLATASITQPIVPDATGGATEAAVSSPQRSETVNADQSPELTIAKAIAANSASSFDEVGETITFEYTLTNSGNVTIPAPLQVTDDQIASGAAQSCSAADLDPGASITCTLVWTAEQTDIDAGSVTNIASPVATFDSAPVPANSDSVTVPAVQLPALEIDKELVSIEDDTYAAGKLVTYRYTVTNIGNTTITTEPAVTDNLIAPADISIDAPFPGTGLVRNASITYTGTYILTLDDIRLGSTTNNATASSDGTTSPPDTVTIPVGATPALLIEKSAQQTEFNAVGDVIDYTYRVTNTSQGTPAPAFANAITVTDDKTTVTCPVPAGGQLLVGEFIDCSAQYVVTQADLDAVAAGQAGGFVTNVATADTMFGTIAVQSPADSVTVPALNDPALTVAKGLAAGNVPASLGETVTYGILATNSGDTTLNGVEIADPLIASLSCFLGTSNAGTPVTGGTTLAPGATLYCEGDYEVTQDDIDAQERLNTATASGTTPAGAGVSQSDTFSLPLALADPDVSITKSLSASEPDSAYSIVGQELEFTVLVQNTGNVTLTSSTVTDDLVPGATCTIGSLAPGEIDDSCVFFYVVTQDDIDNGELTNTASITSVPASDPTNPIEEDGPVTIQGPPAEPALSLVKDADLAEITSEGQIITYSYTVSNTGNVTLTAQPTVTDDRIASVSCPALPIGGLPPLEFITCTATYPVTQDDVDFGSVTNVATAQSAEVPFNPADPDRAEATETVPVNRGPAFTVDKSANDTTLVEVDQVITYSYLVTNTGNVTLTDLTLSDTHTSAAGASSLTLSNGGVVASLLPGESETLTATYQVTQADIDAGGDLTNTVTATATSPAGTTPPTAGDDETVTVADPVPAIDVLKVVSASTGTGVGDTVTFDITVTNTGNVTLSNVGLTDTLRDGSGVTLTPSTPSLISGDGVELDPSEVWVYQLTHTITQDDIDSGGLSNTARAEAEDPFGTEVSDLSDNGTPTGMDTPTGFTIPADPELTAVKSITSTGIELGDTVSFVIEVRNTGNVTLTSVGVTSDTLETVAGDPLTLTTGPSYAGADMGSAEGTLQVGETARYVATYILQQSDIDVGGIQNSAIVAGTPPTGPPVDDTSDNGTPGDGDDNPTVLDIPAAPAFSFVKSYEGTDATFNEVGDVLDYLFTLVNTGNVTLTDAIEITDPLITDAGGTIVCDPVSVTAPWGPDETRECRASYTISQPDLDAGAVENLATADVGDAPSQSDDVTVPALQTPALELTKAAEPVDPATEFFVGAEVTYTYTATNTGNVTLNAPITITDNLIPDGDITCPAFPAAGIAPNGTYVCTGVYTVTTGDVDLTLVTNLASASDGTTTSPLVTETIPNNAVPALSVTKSLLRVTDAAGNDRAGGFETVGDRLYYSFTATNEGGLAFVNDVVINDARLAAPLVCFTATAGDLDFRPGETATCETDETQAYTVTQEDLDAGEVFNEAYAETSLSGLAAPVISDPATVTTPAAADPMLDLIKSSPTADFANVGDVVQFDFALTNTGNQTLTSISVSDPLIPALVCEVDELAPGAVLDCTANYTITQADVDVGSLSNTATAGGITPQGTAVAEVDSSVTVPGPLTEPLSLALTKTATPSPFGAVGSNITYGFAVENTSRFTLTNVTVSDPLIPGFSCVIAELDPGESDTTSCSASYTVTQEDVDRGSLENTASATAGDLSGTRSVTVEDTITTDGPTRAPALEVTKTADVTILAPGQTITYTLLVENTGNVSLEVTGIDDTMTRIATGAPTFLSTPFSLQSGDVNADDVLDVDEVWTYQATYLITQSDLNAGGVENTATVTADGPDGTGSVSDISDDGNDADGNAVDDPTVVEITREPRLDTTKTVLSAGSAIGEDVVFEITATNIGNVDISDLSVSDTLSRLDGSVVGSVTPVPVGGIPAVLSPGDSVVWQLTHALTAEDFDAGGLSNTAQVLGVGPGNTPVDDTSDDGDNSDGNTEDDATTLPITPAPVLDVTKTSDGQTQPPTSAGEVVTFDILVLNTGNVTVSDLSFDDALTNLDGTVLTPDAITFDASALAALGAGESIDVTVSYTLTQEDVDAGGISNVFTATGSSPLGLPVVDASDDGDDTDGNALNDPTEILIPADTTVAFTKTATTPARVGGTVFEVIFTLQAVNEGNVTQRDIIIEDDLTPFVTPATLVDVGAPVIAGFDGGGPNTAYDGVTSVNVLAADTSLVPGATGTVTFAVQYDVVNGSPGGVNTATYASDRVGTALTASTSVAAVELDPDLVATKRVISSGIVQRGSVVTYELTFTNNNTSAEANLTLTDRLPPGMLYLPGSGSLDGAAMPAPVVTGRLVEWPGVTLDPGATSVVQLSARLTGGPGEYVNRAYIVGATGAVISNVATAIVRVSPEAVFDCGDIIGKVFDDQDGDGHQDLPHSLRHLDTLRDIDRGYAAMSEAEVRADGGEPGIAGVKLATPRGDIITTDTYGRYNVPCALLPADIGSNFVLKLDERSLPTGYRVTTENPRAVRVTAGKFARLNFGARLGNLVEIDLTASAFSGEGASAALVQGLAGLVEQIRREPSAIQLRYYRGEESVAVARARLKAAEKALRDAWRGRGTYRLDVERSVRRLQ